MKTSIVALVLSASFLAVSCIPANLQYFNNAMAVRSKRQPNHAMMFTGYYGHQNNDPRQNGFATEPRLNGDSDCKGVSCGGEYAFLPTEEVLPAVEGTTQINVIPDSFPNVAVQPKPEEVIPEVVETSPKLEETATQKELVQKAKKNPVPESEEDDDDSSWPFPKTHMRSQPPLFNFFPIMFGGYDAQGRSGGIPSGATAIANSFSTGRKSIATSNATAYGSDLSAALRSGNYARN